MPIKISKRSKKTKGKGKVSQSQQVIVNIQKGKRKASSQPVSRPSPAPIIIQQPQQDFSQLENLFRQYSTSRYVAEPVKQVVSFETQTENPIMVEREQQTQVSVPTVPPLLPAFQNLKRDVEQTQKQLNERLSQLNVQKEFLDTQQLKSAIDTGMVSERRKKQEGLRRIEKPATNKVRNPDTNRPIMVGGDLYNKLVKEGKIKPE